ncbi:MAG: 30S ribosomal protein S9 [Planctomycetota bacterium]
MSEQKTNDKANFVWGTGRRKTAVARVRLFPGTGEITLNGKAFKEFFPTVDMQNQVLGPLRATEAESKYDVKVNVNGGGPLGQSGAVRLGIARALLRIDAETEPTLRDGGFLTRDARMKERKKYGQRGARRRFQFSKR